MITAPKASKTCINLTVVAGRRKANLAPFLHVGERGGFALMALLLAASLAGCKSGSMSSCVSPCVAGRVVAADTGQPLPGAKVHRVNATQNVDEPAKGGQLMQDATPVAVADQNGNFVLDAETALTPFIHRDFYSVTISFGHPGYLTLQTNYTTFNVNGRTAEGAPKVNTGDIRLKPSR